MAGYSHRSLLEKLGVKAGYRVVVVHAPLGFVSRLEPHNADISEAESMEGFEDLDMVHYFTAGRDDLGADFPRLRQSLKQNGLLWVSWPKRASKVPTALDENMVRDIGLANQMVDVKVAAIDEVWSGLKFVIRLKDRR